MSFTSLNMIQQIFHELSTVIVSRLPSVLFSLDYSVCVNPHYFSLTCVLGLPLSNPCILGHSFLMKLNLSNFQRYKASSLDHARVLRGAERVCLMPVAVYVPSIGVFPVRCHFQPAVLDSSTSFMLSSKQDQPSQHIGLHWTDCEFKIPLVSCDGSAFCKPQRITFGLPHVPNELNKLMNTTHDYQ